ncbi:hypothetical protein Glove_232g150 [Diversispora epigaea]|uniref:Uncharacterized protein n=1 Tax=Diversispora epigaea TaxID=1348612 RepID=A0A397IBJ6_9GLOM|nr:hypothetical protein Glove_232g150 [Diversispora epigaea]
MTLKIIIVLRLYMKYVIHQEERKEKGEYEEGKEESEEVVLVKTELFSHLFKEISLKMIWRNIA